MGERSSKGYPSERIKPDAPTLVSSISTPYRDEHHSLIPNEISIHNKYGVSAVYLELPTSRGEGLVLARHTESLRGLGRRAWSQAAWSAWLAQ